MSGADKKYARLLADFIINVIGIKRFTKLTRRYYGK